MKDNFSFLAAEITSADTEQLSELGFVCTLWDLLLVFSPPPSNSTSLSFHLPFTLESL